MSGLSGRGSLRGCTIGESAFHGIVLGEFLTNQPPVQGAEGRVASPPCRGTMMSIAIEKGLDRRCRNGSQVRRNRLHKVPQVVGV
jgi:hypothetical protein